MLIDTNTVFIHVFKLFKSPGAASETVIIIFNLIIYVDNFLHTRLFIFKYEAISHCTYKIFFSNRWKHLENQKEILIKNKFN